MTMAQTAANQPFQQQQAPVAEMPGDYMSAFAQMRGLQGSGLPYFNQGAQMMAQSADPVTGAQIGNYLNPFADYIMGGMRDLFGQQMKQTTGSLTQAAGGVGADRIGVAQSNLAKQQANAYGQALANQYGNATAAAQQDKARQQAGGFGFFQAAPALQNMLMGGTQGLLGTAGLQQQQRQAELNAPYQWDLARIQHQYQMPQFLSGIGSQQGPVMGGTQTTTYPQQSPWGQIAGLGMTAAGAMMGNPMMMAGGMGGLKGGMGGSQTAGMSPGGWSGSGGGWNPNVSGGYAYPGIYGNRGGAVPYSQGGGVTPDMIGQGFQGGGGAWWDPYTSDPNLLGAPFAPPGPGPTGPPPPEPFNPASWQNQTDVPFAPPLGGPAPMPAPAPMPTPPALPPSGAGSFGDRFAATTDDPRVAAAMEFGDPLPASASVLPPPPAPPAAPSPQLQEPNYTPAGPPPRVPPPQPVNFTPINIPRDTGEGSFERNPWRSLMAAGLKTMAASGERDARGLPMSPLSAVGHGGLEGMKTLEGQEVSRQRRETIAQAASRLEMAAQEAQRQAEAHPLEQQKRQADILTTQQTLSQKHEKHPLDMAQTAQEIAIRRAQEGRTQELHGPAVRTATAGAGQAEENLRYTTVTNPTRQKKLEMDVEQDETKFKYTLAGLKRADQIEEMAFTALQNVRTAMASQSAMGAIGLTPDQAAQAGPAKVQAMLMERAKGKYTFHKTEDGRLIAVDPVDPKNNFEITGGNTDIGARYGIEWNEPRATTVPGAAGPTTAIPPPSAVPGRPPVPPPVQPRQVPGVPATQVPPGAIPPGGAVPAGPRLPTSVPGVPMPPRAQGQPVPNQPAPVVGDPGLAYGPPGSINWLASKLSGMATGRVTPTQAEQQLVTKRLELLRDKLATVLARGDERLLAQRYKEMEKIFPKVGSAWTTAPEAKAFFTAADDELQSRINANRNILEAPGHRTKHSEVGLQTAELTRLQREVRAISGALPESSLPQERRQPQARMRTPSADAVSDLRGNDTPERRRFFDQWYGPGSAARILGSQ